MSLSQLARRTTGDLMRALHERYLWDYEGRDADSRPSFAAWMEDEAAHCDL